MKRRNDHNFTTAEQVGAWYSAKYAEMGGCWHTPVEELDAHLQALGLRPGATLLDIGCGDGSLLLQARKITPHVYGVEASQYAINLCRAQNVWSVLQGNMECLPWDDNFMDFCISLGSMEHALDIPRAVWEMARVLKPSGRWLLYVPNESWHHEDQPLETTMTGEEWLAILQDAGLTVDRIERMGDNNRITGGK